MNSDIDIVVPWVNPADETWFKSYSECCKKYSGDKSPQRIRDFEIFKYFFRCIEKNAPWVRKVHLLLAADTQIPDWLNTKCNKLVIHFHDEIMEPEYLPTFNNLHFFHNSYKMRDLAENYIWLNDDIFIVNPTTSEDFFINNLPVDNAKIAKLVASNPVHEKILVRNGLTYSFKLFENMKFNRVTDMEFFQRIVNNTVKLFYKYTKGKKVLYSNLHTGFACNKSDVKRIFEQLKPDIDKAMTTSKFRVKSNINSAWLYRYIRMNENNYVQKDLKDFIYMELHHYNFDELFKIFLNKKLVCINDILRDSDDFNVIKKRLKLTFDAIVPKKSEFEV